jgi:hypothetical protein
MSQWCGHGGPEQPAGVRAAVRAGWRVRPQVEQPRHGKRQSDRADDQPAAAVGLWRLAQHVHADADQNDW